MNDRADVEGYDHSGPPPYVPLSGGAVTALILSIVAFFIGIVGPWWCEVVPLLIVLMCWGGISRRRRRGKVVAILALVFSLVGAGVCYVIQKAASIGLGEAFAPVVRALEKDDRAALEKWAGTGPDRDERIARWTARAKAAWAAEGAFRGDLDVSFMSFGLVAGLIAPPNYREEFEPKGAKPPELGATFWFRAPCANGVVYVAFDYGTPEKFKEAMSKAKEQKPSSDDRADGPGKLFTENLEEIRFFH